MGEGQVDLAMLLQTMSGTLCGVALSDGQPTPGQVLLSARWEPDHVATANRVAAEMAAVQQANLERAAAQAAAERSAAQSAALDALLTAEQRDARRIFDEKVAAEERAAAKAAAEERAAIERAEEEAAELASDPPEKRWLKLEWSEVALRRQLALLEVELPRRLSVSSEREWPAGLTINPFVRELANLLWDQMQRSGVSFEEIRRVQNVGNREYQVLLWAECVVGRQLTHMSMHEALSSGEVLCDLANAIFPGVVTRITRSPAERPTSTGRHARLAAKQRENIAYYLDACAVFEIREDEYFDPSDLYDAK